MRWSHGDGGGIIKAGARADELDSKRARARAAEAR